MQTLESPMQTSNPILRADRISRLGNKSLGRMSLDQSAITQLCTSQIALFAEGFLSQETMLGRLLPLASKSRDKKSVVLYACKDAGNSIYKLLAEGQYCAPIRKTPEKWWVGNLLFSSVEGLSHIDDSEGSIDSLFLLDPSCMVYRGRTMRLANGSMHDRPQIVADFLFKNYLASQPIVFMLMTTRRAAALPTDAIARTFCQEAFWFIDGPSMCC